MNIVCVILIAIASSSCLGTPLDDYVNTPDPVFKWTLLQTYSLSTHTFYVLNMTSQKWLDESFSSQPIWWHYMTITVPKTIQRPKTAFLLIGHGENTNPAPTTDITTELALAANCITASVNQIPNQPFYFTEDPLRKSRREDSLIAWTWKKFLDTNGNDPRVLLRFPMTKAVVRAMDTVQQFVQQGNFNPPQEFVIGGFSKRGWTTWTTAAVDNKRVVGAIPMVMDLVNLVPSMMLHYRNLGGWTFAFNDYYELNITRYVHSSGMVKLGSMVDPYSYFDRYSKTKILQIQGAGDEFFLPDSEDTFWNDLQIATGGSYLQRIPNTGHGLQGYQNSLASFFISVADRTTLPSMKWTRSINETHGIIQVTFDYSGGRQIPSLVTAFQARTSDTLKRDFRQSKLNPLNGRVVGNPVVWTSKPTNFAGLTGTTLTYSFTEPIPKDGYWVATFLQATFPGTQSIKLTLTTETLILPNTYAVKECFDQECYGQLV